jgi:DNA-binding winged helix-turn-helix (wHTH) protein
MNAYRFDDYRLDVDRQLLIAKDQAIPLSEKSFRVLHCLVRAAGRTVTKDELAAEVWKHEDPSDATVVQHIWIVRRLLEDRVKAHKYIITVPRSGYRFVPPVIHEADAVQKPRPVTVGDGAKNDDAGVWHEYLIGIRLSDKRDHIGYRMALRHYNAALALDRAFAPAWMGIAGAYSNMAFYGFVTWKSILPQAIEAITKAIQFDPTSAFAHCLLAQIKLAQWDVLGAERTIERAGDFDGGSAAVYQLSSFIHAWRGESESAIADAKRGIAFQPNDIALHGIFASALAAQGDYRNAIVSYSKILEFNPAPRIARQGRCEAYVAAGELHLAMGDLEQLPRTHSNLSRLACVRAFMGDELGATRLLMELQRRSLKEYVEPHCIAQIQIALGHYDEAMWLTDKAIASNDLAFPAMLTSPLLAEPMKNPRLRHVLLDMRKLLNKSQQKIG